MRMGKGGVVGHPVGPSNSTPRSMGRHEVRDVGTFPVAGSNPAPSPYRSKWESAYASKLALEHRAGLIIRYWYEPFSIWLPGKVRYKPDFMIERHSVNPWGGQMNPNIEIIEVKGWSRNRRDGMTRLKIAAALFPCFIWTLVRKTKDGWEEEHV